jgi:hypothetical protein
LSKRTNRWTEDKIARYYAEGRGSGELTNYKPWLTVQNVPSSGRVHRIKGWTAQRIHHLLSDLERDYFYLLDWSDSVIDIREQFPLEREKTLTISESKKIKHPDDSETKTPLVFTTDFFVTIRKNATIEYLARTIKPSQLLNDPRIIDKFEIERQYWKDLKVDWGIITEKDLPKQICQNISWVHSSYELPEEDLNLSFELYNSLKNGNRSILQTLKTFDENYACEHGIALAVLKHLIARKYVHIEMDQHLNLQDSVRNLKFSLLNKQKRDLAK